MVEIEMRDGVGVLRLAHGKVNALDLELLEQIGTELDGIAASNAGALIVTGRGNSFSAGVDLFRLLDGGKDYLNRFLPELTRTLVKLYTFPKPVVAAINGHAIAGGCILAAACDYRLMARGSGRIGVPELAVGVPFPLIAIEILRDVMPDRHTQDVVYNGTTYPVELARERGLVDELVASDRLEDRAIEVAERFASIPAASFRLTKQLLRGHAMDRWHREAEAVDRQVLDAWASEEVQSAIRSYLDKTLGGRGK